MQVFHFLLFYSILFNKYQNYLIRALDLPEAAKALSSEKNFDLQGYGIDAQVEQTRPRRLVKIGAIQNQIVLPTDAPVQQQVFFE